MTQTQKVLKLLKEAKGEWVSTRDIMQQTWITRAPARILDLKKMGYEIESGGFDEYGFKKYRLPVEEPQTLSLV